MYVCRDFAHDRPCHIGEKFFDPYDVPCMTCFYCDYYPDSDCNQSEADTETCQENKDGAE